MVSTTGMLPLSTEILRLLTTGRHLEDRKEAQCCSQCTVDMNRSLATLALKSLLG